MESVRQTVSTIGGEKTIEDIVATLESMSQAIKDMQERISNLEGRNPINRGYYRGGTL